MDWFPNQALISFTSISEMGRTILTLRCDLCFARISVYFIFEQPQYRTRNSIWRGEDGERGLLKVLFEYVLSWRSFVIQIEYRSFIRSLGNQKRRSVFRFSSWAQGSEIFPKGSVLRLILLKVMAIKTAAPGFWAQVPPSLLLEQVLVDCEIHSVFPKSFQSSFCFIFQCLTQMILS